MSNPTWAKVAKAADMATPEDRYWSITTVSVEVTFGEWQGSVERRVELPKLTPEQLVALFNDDDLEDLIEWARKDVAATDGPYHPTAQGDSIARTCKRGKDARAFLEAIGAEVKPPREEPRGYWSERWDREEARGVAKPWSA
jgi:hypothetical protein